MDTWGISIDILFLFLGYFIVLFIWMPGAFNKYFIAIKIARKWKTIHIYSIGAVLLSPPQVLIRVSTISTDQHQDF